MKETKVTLKKIVLGIFMCLALVMIGMPAEEVKATGNTPTATPTPQVTAPVFDSIDTTKTGSITIHKYEYNGAATSTGTGADKDKNNVPQDAKPLEGVTFTVYQVQYAAWLKDYYDGNKTINSYDVTDVKVSDYCNDDGTLKDGITAIDGAKNVTTGPDGIAYVGSLPVGLYVVAETGTPAQVTEKASPFLVSIPMTIDGDKWLYDVHVFPKNKTSYAGITLTKQGISAEGQTSPASLVGVTYVLQKKTNDSPETWTNVTNRADTNEELTLSTGNSGTISVEGLAPGTYRFIETSIGNNYGYILDGATAYQFTIDTSGNISYTSPDSQTQLSGANVTIPIKNYKPSIEKKVLPKGTPAPTPAIDADYSVGDTIQYQATVYVPENIASLATFKLKDSPTNITDDKESISISCSEQSVILTKDTDYTVEALLGNADGFEITFDTSKDAVKNCAGKTLTITYDAKLKDGADMTNNGNKNTMSLEYTNNIAPETPYPSIPTPTPDGTTTTTITDEAVVYTFKLEVVKTDEDGTTKLENATFDLYGEYIDGVTDAGTNNSKKISSETAGALGLPNGKTYVKIGTGTSDNNGELVFAGLSNGTYYLVETKAPSEYNLLAKPVVVKLDFDYTTATITPTASPTQVYVKQIDSANSTLADGGGATTNLTYEDNNGKITGTATITIVNRKGFTLPTTGGAGSFLFTLIGCAIMIGGFIIFRKTSAKKSDVA